MSIVFVHFESAQLIKIWCQKTFFSYMTLIMISDQIFPDFNNGISEGFVRVREEWGR